MKSKKFSSEQQGASIHGAFDTFIFDVDGTLLDTLPDLVLLTNAVLRECGYPERTSHEILGFVGNGVKALMYQAVPESAGGEQVEEAMRRWKDLYPQYGHHLTKPYPGILSMLAELKNNGAKLGVLSNKFDAGVQEVVTAYLPDIFMVAHGESVTCPRKPDPTGLLLTMEELQATPEHTVYVGDSVGDITVSRNAKIGAVGVTWGYHEAERLQKASPDLLIDHPRMLLPLMKQKKNGCV